MDISNNSARAEVIRDLARAASEGAPSAALQAWSVPGDHSPHPTPVVGVGNVWQQLNSLRVMAQYTRILGTMCSEHLFLQGHPTTCVHGLEWFSRLAGPMQMPDKRAHESLVRTLETFRSNQTGQPMSLKQASFEVNSKLCCHDRGMLQLLISYHFPAAAMEYDVDICNYMLSRPGITYAEWLSEFPRRREKGLYYPMVLASMYMPSQEHWLPPAAHSTPLAISFAHCMASLADPEENHCGELLDLQSAWEEDKTGTAHVLAGTLDRLAVLMGVKSNGRPGSFDLPAALALFPRSFGDSMHESNFRAWRELKSAVEKAFPPSLLCSPLVRPKRHTWGYSKLTLQVGCCGDVYFAERTLESVPAASKLQEGGVHHYTPAFAKECLLGQTSHRVQDVLWRLGEVVTSHDVAACMLHPKALSGALQGNAAQCMQHLSDKSAVMSSMQCSSQQQVVDPDYLDFTKALDAAVPSVELAQFERTQSVLLWRMDVPSRAIVYLGWPDAVDPYAESQHHLSKALVHSKVPQYPVVGGICLAEERADETAVRGCLKAFAADGLLTHPGNTVLVKADDGSSSDEDQELSGCQVVPIACTTLAESVACFALRPASHLTVCQLGSSCPWKEGGIDPRYAERQQAENGLRFRDWAAMHAGKGGTQQSRLASHVVEFDSIFTTKMPWVLNEADPTSVRWVRVASTAKPDSKTLQGKTLRQAVESRFLHDLRMLPVRGDLGAQRVERSNAEVYSGSDSCVAIAYAPTGQNRLELMAFEVEQ